MIPAKFFDGVSAQEKIAEVRIAGRDLIVKILPSGTESSIHIENLEIIRSHGEVTLSMGDQSLILSSYDFERLGLKQNTYSEREYAPVIQAMAIAATFILIIYLFYQPIIKFASGLIPENFFEAQVKSMEPHWKSMTCKKDEPNLREIFGRLGENIDEYKVYLIQDEIPNAFALPGKVIIINSGLLKVINSPEALAGIIAHEIAHIKANHINKKYAKDFFIDTIWKFTLGQATDIPIQEFAKGLFTQSEEREADQMAAKTLIDQKISFKGMADFFRNLERKETKWEKYLILSHPAYPDRIKTFTGEHDSEPVLSPGAWEELKSTCP